MYWTDCCFVTLTIFVGFSLALPFFKDEDFNQVSGTKLSHDRAGYLTDLGAEDFGDSDLSDLLPPEETGDSWNNIVATRVRRRLANKFFGARGKRTSLDDLLETYQINKLQRSLNPNAYIAIRGKKAIVPRYNSMDTYDENWLNDLYNDRSDNYERQEMNKRQPFYALRGKRSTT